MGESDSAVLWFQVFDFSAQTLRACRGKELKVGEERKPFILYLFIL